MRVPTGLLLSSVASHRARHLPESADERGHWPSVALGGIHSCSSPFCERQRACQRVSCGSLRHPFVLVTLLGAMMRVPTGLLLSSVASHRARHPSGSPDEHAHLPSIVLCGLLSRPSRFYYFPSAGLSSGTRGEPFLRAHRSGHGR